MERAKQIMAILLVCASVCAVVIVVGAIGVVATATHYLGVTVVTTEAQKSEITEMIDANFIGGPGPINIWSTPYTIEEDDNGVEILRYAFFSRNKDLNLTEAK